QFVKEIIDNNSSSLLSSQRTIKTLPYKVLNINENPYFDYRFIYFSQGFDIDYQLKNRLSTFGVDPETGKVTFENCGSVIHNFLLLFGYDRHFESHPEYYPYINGKRTKVGLQEGDAYRVPCL